jgi:uncharacterized DUF497 family protein
MVMKIEYDPEKRKKTLKERGLDFEDALIVFTTGRRISKIDSRKDYGEERVITMGELAGRHVVIVHTRRGNAERIISMRKADEREATKFEEAFENGVEGYFSESKK